MDLEFGVCFPGFLPAACAFSETRPVMVKIDLLRPNGFSAHTVVWKP